MRYSTYAMTLAALFMLNGCESEKPVSQIRTETNVETPTQAEAEATPGIAITAGHASPHFHDVLARLDVGGKSLSFQDHEGQRELWIGLLGLVLGNSAGIGLPEGLDPATIIDESGLASAAASGHSLVKDDDHWLLRHYVHHPAGLPGTARLLGEAMAFEMQSALPATTDIALECRINASHLPGTMRKITASTELAEMLEEYLQQELPIGMTMGEALSHMDLRLLFGMELMDTGSEEMPVMPKSWGLRILANPVLVSACIDLMTEGLGEPTLVENGQQWQVPIPGVSDGQPTLTINGGDTLILASDASYFSNTDRSGETLGDHPLYQASTNHFPSEGNLQAYLSPKVATSIHKWVVATSAEDAEGFISASQTLNQFLPDKPWSICVACEKTGIMTLVEMPFAFDGNTTAALGALSASSTLFVGARAWKRGSDRAACMLNVRNVQQAIRGHENMYNLSRGTPIVWSEIFGPDGYLNEPVCPEGGTYTFSLTIPQQGRLACECSIHGHRMNAEDHVDW